MITLMLRAQRVGQSTMTTTHLPPQDGNGPDRATVARAVVRPGRVNSAPPGGPPPDRSPREHRAPDDR
ncbi:hypothetical protein HGI15_05980 [Modestobacter lapidis]|nr:hypothetical protein [Modestobacter lapidis]